MFGDGERAVPDCVRKHGHECGIPLKSRTPEAIFIKFSMEGKKNSESFGLSPEKAAGPITVAFFFQNVLGGGRHDSLQHVDGNGFERTFHSHF